MLYAATIGGMREQTPEDIVAKIWANDNTALVFTRATTTPMSSANAPDLLPSLAASILSGILPKSKAVALFGSCVQLDFRGPANRFFIPRGNSVPSPVFIAEGAPHPVAQMAFDQIIIGPASKMVLGVGLTNELQTVAPESGSQIIGKVLEDQAAPALDAVAFDANAASASRPAGLLAGLSTLGATVNGTLAALVSDLAKIADNCASGGCDPDRLMFFCSPLEAIKLRTLVGPNFTYPVFSVASLADGTIVGVDPAAIATGFNGLPQVDVAKETVVVFEDQNPTDITTGAAAAANTKSTWQTDSFVIRLIVRCSWGTLASGAVGFISGVTW